MNQIENFKLILESNPEIISNYMNVYAYFINYIGCYNDPNITHKEIYDFFTKENIFIKDISFDILLDKNKCNKLLNDIKKNIKL